LPIEAALPEAPITVTVIELTPAGTVQDCADPV
jgi:hypothetical protein